MCLSMWRKEGKFGNFLEILLRFPMNRCLPEIPHPLSPLLLLSWGNPLPCVCFKTFLSPSETSNSLLSPSTTQGSGCEECSPGNAFRLELQMNQGSSLPEPLHLPGAVQWEQYGQLGSQNSPTSNVQVAGGTENLSSCNEDFVSASLEHYYYCFYEQRHGWDSSNLKVMPDEKKSSSMKSWKNAFESSPQSVFHFHSTKCFLLAH